jgi:GNAT superfamily N-acetyltransferase/predicted nucleic acid-binding protein
VELRTAAPGSEIFRAAQTLGDSHSQYLGSLPYAAWQEYAERGQILCAVGPADSEGEGEETLLGYAAFRLPRQELALAHLVVDPDHRGSGVARSLVDELARRHPDRRGIRARCRRDYASHAMWPKIGFVARGNRPGRSAEGHLLTDWWYDFGHEDLLTWQGGDQSVVSAVIDANVFLDIHGASPNKEVVAHIEGMEDRLQILVSPELSNEINKNNNAAERSRLLAIAQNYPRLPVQLSDVENFKTEILKRIGSVRRPQDHSDVTHIAYALAAGVDVVVTRDRKARSRLAGVARDLGNIALTSPANLVAVLDEREGKPAYAPAALHDTGYSMNEAGGDGAALREFLNTNSGERRSAFDRTCEYLAGQRPKSTRLIISDPEGRPVALAGAAPSEIALEVHLARIRPCALQVSVATQLVGQLRNLAYEHGCDTVIVRDQHLHAVIYTALLEDGFHPFDGGLLAVTLNGVHPAQDLRTRLDVIQQRLPQAERAALSPLLAAVDSPTAHNMAAVERQLRPVRVSDAPIESWILPIRPTFAADLFGYPSQLFARPTNLGMSREHVYYRGQKSGEASPARILWYASTPEQCVFAVSTLIGVSDSEPGEAHRRFKRLGVYTYEQVSGAAAKSGSVRALQLADTELLERPVPYSRLQQLAANYGQTPQLWSATRISPQLFTDLMEEAGCGAEYD